MSTTYHIETDKGAYDIEVDDSQQAQDQPAQQPMGMMDQAKLVARMVPEAYKLTPMGRADSSIADNPQQLLPVAGAMVGSTIAPGPGTAAGAGLGQVAKRMIDIKTGKAPGTPLSDPNAMLFPSSPSDAASEAVAPMAQTAVAGAPEVDSVKAGVQKVTQNLAARGVGLKGALLKRIGMDKARDVGQTMLDEGVIKGTSPGTEATLERAKEAAQTSGKEIGEGLSALDEAGVKSFNPRAIARKVYNQIKPGRLGGAYNAQELAAREVRDTILAHRAGGGPITFDSAQTLKETLQDMGKFNTMTDQMKSKMYRQAAGIVKQAMEDSIGNAAGSEIIREGGPSVVGTDITAPGEKVLGEVGNIDPDVLQRYQKAKKVYGAAETATEGLTNRLNAEASSGPSLRGTIIAAGAASQGHLTPALEALGAYEATARYGARVGASTLNFLNNSPLAENVRRAVMSEFISRITTKGDQ